MIVKKSGKKVFGANLSVAEKKALQLEIERQIAEQRERLEKEIEIVTLYALHEEFGFGKVRLHRFYKSFAKTFNDLIKRYEMDQTDGIWLCEKMLSDHGVDLNKWRDENNGQEEV